MKLAIEPAINLLHAATYSTLATQSVQAPGYPYATAVPSVLDESHRPLLLVSALAEHTKNLLADPRVSLSLLEPGAGNVQTAARITLLGDAEQFAPHELLKARYLRYLPEAEQYLQLDFMFFRIIPKRLRHIAGVGRMGWLEAIEWHTALSLSLAQENRLLEAAQSSAPDGVLLLGIDGYGIDYSVDGIRKRRTFAGGDVHDVMDEEFLRSAVAQLS
jgi:putative heme iron utilization protein